jgi:hypothetical protein
VATTYDALVSDDNAWIETTIAIEGYQYILTTGSASAAVTAYSGTDWSSALSGLSVFWKLETSLNPWEPLRGGGQTLSFSVMDATGSDTFGIDTHKKTAGVSSPLASSKDPDDTTIVVLRSDDFAAANSTIYCGVEAIGYTTNTTGTETFSTLTRGKWSPFTASDGDRFARSHRVNSTIPGVNLAPDVTDIPTEWVGKWVAVRLHRVVGGVYDTVAESHLAFAGRIAAIRDGEDGQTHVELEHVLDVIASTPVFREPWRARVREGVWLRQGVQFTAQTQRTIVGVGSTTAGSATPFTVGAPGSGSSASGVEEGFYSASQLQFFLNRWLADAYAGSDIVLAATITTRANTTDGIRCAVEWADNAAGTGARIGKLVTNANWVAQFLGWEPSGMDFGTFQTLGASFSTASGTSYSTREPTRVATIVTDSASEVEYTNAQGSWFDQSLFVPTSLAAGSFTKGVVKVGGGYYLASTPSAGAIEIRRSDVLNKLAGIEPQAFGASGTGILEIQQVLVLEGSFYGQFLAFLLSTGATGFNSPNFDVFPEHVGVGIPYSLLGADFETELATAPGAGLQRTVIIEKPTIFADLFEWPMTLRHLQPIWGNGRISLTGWATPTSGATLTVTEAMKHVPVGQQDKAIAVSEQSDRFLRNLIKIDFDRLPFQDTYQSSHTIDHKRSQNANGQRSITIKARDAVSGGGLLGENIDSLLPGFIAGLPFLTRPVHLVRVPISFTQFLTHRPGQSVLFTDLFVRDPSTGTRSITGKPALIIGSWYDWGGGENGRSARAPQGELTLMLFPGRTLAPYAPCADIDESVSSGGFSAGYNSGVPSIRLKAHAYSESADSNDATHFEANDVILIVEKDPSDPAAPTTWTRTVVSRSSNDLTLSSTLSAPAWDAAKTYRIYSAAYASAQATQQTDCYQADDADAKVADAREAYALAYYGAGQVSSFTAGDPSTDLPERHVAAAYGDGKALDAGNAFVIARNLNNLTQYATSPQTPFTYSEEGTFGSPAGSQDWRAVRIEPICIGKGVPTPTEDGQRTRFWYVAPIFRSSDGASASVRVTLLRDLPSVSEAGTWDLTRPLPYREATFTDTSTSNVFPSATALDISHLRLGDETFGGVGWLLTEVSEKGIFVGHSESYLGPVEAA